MDSYISTEVIEGLFAMGGVALAALLVVWFAVWRLRRERAFDRRLRWCEQMMKGLNSAGVAVVTAAEQNKGSAGHEVCWEEAVRVYEKLIPLCGQKELYASSTAVAAIQEFMKAFHQLIEKHLETHNNPNAQENCTDCLKKLRAAADCLSKAGRGHLGMKPLPANLIDPDERFLGSFRGRAADHL